jgi:hypothetical protein
LIASAVLVVAGLLYSFFWLPVVGHRTGWVQPGDLWGTYRAAHYVGWGDIGDVYTAGTGFITFPGIAILLAPIAILTDHLGLSESFPRAIAHPSAWFVLGPVLILVGLLPLFAFDAVGEYLGTPRRIRVVLCWAQVVLLWPLVVVWGHPEDAISVGLAVYGLIATWKGQWARGGWLFGAALLFQPVAVLFLPIVLALHPDARRRMSYLVRVALPSAVALAIPTVQNWSATTYALIKQPTFPSVDHPTPLLFLAPVLGQYGPGTQTVFLHGATGRRFVAGVVGKAGEIVAPGVGRFVAVAFAVAVGLWAWRRRPSPVQTLWLAALVLGAWCACEPVMTPYYTWAVLALVVTLAGLASSWRLAVTIGAAIFVTVWTQHFFSPWVWWGPTVLMIGLGLYCSRPVGVSRLPETQPEAVHS